MADKLWRQSHIQGDSCPHGITGEQYVLDIIAGKIVREQKTQAAALDYATLWTPSTTAGQVAGTSLRTGTPARTITTKIGTGWGTYKGLF